MLKATYDTSALVSGTTISQGPIANVINAWINDDVEMITSEPLVDELTRTLHKPYFTSKLSEKQIKSFINLVKERATIAPIITHIPTISKDPDDNMVLATAESGNASYVVTGDHQLQEIKQYKKIKIVSPRIFSEIIREKNVA
ncbi:MAG: putative toxin-antitoxin system toxin component, PIN family [Candidatus Levybacteria bacterium RBG_16_35_11]|nr:MAG: putative toxin-antitoxin system toxin component, PIN family [Candidatus Levybacteria bacterium RBG_16_35_11]